MVNLMMKKNIKKFIDNLLHPKYDNISINFDNISKEELNSILTIFNINEEEFKKLIAELK